MNALPKWYSRAACRDMDVNVFFPEDYAGRTAEVEAYALETCAACPVRAACLDNALAEEHGRGNGGRYGIRGGKRPRQRYGIYRRRQDREGASDSGVRLSDTDRLTVGRRAIDGENVSHLAAEYGISTKYVRNLRSLAKAAA